MTLLERLQAKRKARQDLKKQVDEKNARGFEKDLKLEKGDLPAIIIAGLLNFVLPIMLVIGAVCGIAYLLFTIF